MRAGLQHYRQWSVSGNPLCSSYTVPCHLCFGTWLCRFLGGHTLLQPSLTTAVHDPGTTEKDLEKSAGWKSVIRRCIMCKCCFYTILSKIPTHELQLPTMKGAHAFSKKNPQKTAIEPFRTVAHARSHVSEHLEDSTNWLPSYMHTWAHRCPLLMSLWLTGESVSPSLPLREQWQMSFLGPLSMDGCGIIGIHSCDLLMVGFSCTTSKAIKCYCFFRWLAHKVV